MMYNVFSNAFFLIKYLISIDVAPLREWWWWYP
jgi:hypothetical protein